MAHFAQLDETNTVTRVVVIPNDTLLDENGNEVESLGVAACESLIGPGNWVQTSYNANFRKQFAGIGYTYNSDADVFISCQPSDNPSWVLDANFDWEPPVAEPTEGGPYEWNEQTQTWDQVTVCTDPNPNEITAP